VELGLHFGQRCKAAPNAPQPLKAALPFAAAALLVLVLLLFGLPWALVLTAAAATAVFAFVRAGRAAREREELRRSADELLALGIDPRPDSALLTWRAGELTSPRCRRSLGRSVERIVNELEGPALPSAVPLYRRGARAHLDLLRALADRLNAVDRPVSPVGLVLVEDLLTDGFGSPLYVRERADALGPVLEECLAALQPPTTARWDTRPTQEVR
jgi:hypothetical protein